ncbi:hypothetical protein SFBM_1292 [Candidatus Arthromitus sp. SFB-mouse-Japan]|uniref:hypothetical protein n=1 Tax=unclassified Candidatus Neoarthromitus TaxID=2638829 RepID=UPI00021B80EA|nr:MULTISPECIES: hypothetical protein [unclassified Candidatus Arthromitus]EIA22770.1 hypothetical protein SFB2_225G2 [Candidatus Arthromitus sp. SFB-2]EIA26480.1 hypothetical protein SFB3_020G3 [Candidatus Arthromitus sp. SFB-3]EIA28657.1 hypothetical protein SFB4_104G5 [Candidatus Arthromitus sp. SFB-4]EIA29355.1 hypothetical protein SFB6_006G21 [Candidatus Arthromitus sp. SFB-co]EIA30069.1 hypothetical protein SFBSU_007G208 [Candidatus Arthromitus sp. SFB-mouse-SU]
MMNLLNVMNKNFYWLMIIVIGILAFIELREVNQLKNDKNVCKALIWIYSFGTLGIFIINILK